MPLSVGDKLGPYEILAPIGAGGMGEVFRARDPRMGREVAVKISAERFSERFDKEVRAIASLNHPNICTLHDVGPNYLVMELIDGPTLADRIKEGAIPLDGGPTTPPRESWYAEPAKVADNFYFIGTRIHSAWALTGSQGIIVIEALFDYAAKDEILNGLKKMGLDKTKVKYVILSHAHADHDGGAKLLQDEIPGYTSSMARRIGTPSTNR